MGGIGMGAGYTMRKRRNKRDGRRLFYRKVAMAGDRTDGREKNTKLVIRSSKENIGFEIGHHVASPAIWVSALIRVGVPV